MTLTHRIMRRLGYDTTRTFTDTKPLFKYTITHLNGEESTEVANGHTLVEGFCRVKSVTDVSFIDYMIPVSPSYSVVRELEGIQEIEREKVGLTEMSVTIDQADYTVLDTEINHQ